MNIQAIISFIDNYLAESGKVSIGPVEANQLLAKAGILNDSTARPGKPLRDLLRNGHLPHAYQNGSKGSSWIIPVSKMQKSQDTIRRGNVNSVEGKNQHRNSPKKIPNPEKAILSSFNSARLKYKPDFVKYLIIAEAPPDSLNRFFYFENVAQHDYLFLGITEALYPRLKQNFLKSGRNSIIKQSILDKFRHDGFYLLDLSELPRQLTPDLRAQIPKLIKNVKSVANSLTKIILVKANVYDIAFAQLTSNFDNVIDKRITFPAQGGQAKFQLEFKDALKIAGYFK